MKKSLQEELTEAFQAMGLSESAAQIAARGRDGLEGGSDEDPLTEAFRRLGLSESEARIAARGRDGWINIRETPKLNAEERAALESDIRTGHAVDLRG
jgi:hypothetical protein